MSEPRRPDPAAFGSQIGAACAREAALWVEAQRDLVTNLGAVVTDWLHCRGEMLDLSSRAMQLLSQCRSLAELLRVQQDWASDCLRLTTGAAGEDADAGTRKPAARFARPAREEAVEVRREAARRRSAAASEMATAE